jgi:hypothetical protein
MELGLRYPLAATFLHSQMRENVACEVLMIW